MDDCCLVKALLDRNKQSEAEVRWEGLISGRSGGNIKKSWRRLQKRLQVIPTASFRDQLQQIVLQYMPDLLGPISNPSQQLKPATELRCMDEPSNGSCKEAPAQSSDPDVKEKSKPRNPKGSKQPESTKDRTTSGCEAGERHTNKRKAERTETIESKKTKKTKKQQQE